MKKVLLLFRAKPENKPKGVAFAEKVDKLIGEDVSVTTAEISELFFEVSTNFAKIYHPKQGFDVKDFDLVIIRHIGALDVEAHAVAVYCRKYGIKFTDSYLDRIIDDKLSASFEHWLAGANLPRTFYGDADELARRLPELGEKAIYKDNRGHKGLLNYVVKSAEEIQKINKENPGIRFILQEFIPNDGDLRVLVLNYKPALVIKRQSDGDSHLNNTSQGGSAELIPLEEIPTEILEMSVSVSRAEGLEVSGVDIITDKKTGKFYILEVNHAPQISSGTFLDEKVEKYVEMISELLD